MAQEFPDETLSRTLPVIWIDAWRDGRDGPGWYWNDMRRRGAVPHTVADLSDRRLLRTLRREGLLSAGSAGRVYVNRDDDYITVCDRATGRPLVAIDLDSYYDKASLDK